MPLNANILAIIFFWAVLFGTAQNALADIRNFTPPKLDYAKICIVKTHKDEAPDKPNSALTPKEKFVRARMLFAGTDTVIADPAQSAQLLEDVIRESKTELQAAGKFYLSLLLISGNGVTRDEKRALTLLEEAMPYNPASNAFALADYYDRHKQYAKAEEYYKRAGAAGHARAYLKLSFLYREGLVPSPSPNAAEEMIGISQNLMLQRLSEGGCSVLQEIASLFITNKYRIFNDKLAMMWLREGDKAKIVPSMLMLADAYETGFRGEKNNAEALRIWKEVAASGNAVAMYRLGKNMILSPETTDDAEAISWLEKSALRDNRFAYNTLIAYYNGEYGHPQNPAKTAEWLEKSISGERVTTANIYHLAEAYATGNGVTKDEKIAFSLYEKASAAGSLDALFRLGEAHLHGYGTPRNPIKSYRFFRLSGSQSNGDSITAIIKNYHCGIAKPANPKLAEKWRQRGLYHGVSNLLSQEATKLLASKSSKDNEKAIFLLARWVKQEVAKRSRANLLDTAHVPMIMLSVAFTKGIGVAKDPERAARWRKRAIAKTLNQAAGFAELGKAYLDPNMLGLNTKKALVYLHKAYDLLPVSASFQLGHLYLNGTAGVPANKVLAEKYFRDGVNYNEPKSMRRLGITLLADANLERQKEGVKWLSQASDNGDLEAALKLATYFIRNKNIPKAEAKAQAVYWLEKAKTYYPCTADAHKKVKTLSEQLQGVRSTEQLAQDANAGDISAMRKLAANHLFTNQTKDALYWYKRAAHAGDNEAMLELGNMYLLGIGVPPSHSKAKIWWAKAADAGNLEAVGMLKKSQQ